MKEHRLRLKGFTVHKYKCFSTDQHCEVEKDITTLIGLNESGKTSVLEALSKLRYYKEGDSNFVYDQDFDYPRNELRNLEKGVSEAKAITCSYQVPDGLMDLMIDETSGLIELSSEIEYSHNYITKSIEYTFNVKTQKLDDHLNGLGINPNWVSKDWIPEALSKLQSIQNEKEVKIYKFLESYNKKIEIDTLLKYFWNNYIEVNIPHFWYFDEYRVLDHRVSFSDMANGNTNNYKIKTARALLELASIDPDDLINADNYERFNARLNSISSVITRELKEYWEQNKNINIRIDIEKEESRNQHGQPVINKYLQIRVVDTDTYVEVPLSNRSKGFQWFFSFLIWFRSKQESNNKSYILLFDEPGLSLHGLAQEDLLNFLKDLSNDFQILYTTHSPFLVDYSSLNKVRTVLYSSDGSKIQKPEDVKDKKTLFPLQAALGYNLSQNLFIGEYNLLVEGVSDLVYLEIAKLLLEKSGKETLNQLISIVPIGGAGKISTFMSLLYGNKLKYVVLLDSTNSSDLQLLQNAIKNKLLTQKHVIYFHDFVEDLDKADIEDLFDAQKFMALYSKVFSDKRVQYISGDYEAKNVLSRIKHQTSENRFNHYLPANYLLTDENEKLNLYDEISLPRFEALFNRINTIFAL